VTSTHNEIANTISIKITYSLRPGISRTLPVNDVLAKGIAIIDHIEFLGAVYLAFHHRIKLESHQPACNTKSNYQPCSGEPHVDPSP
jgi:hypothetical protein